jgi:hypothetical protein
MYDMKQVAYMYTLVCTIYYSNNVDAYFVMPMVTRKIYLPTENYATLKNYNMETPYEN